MGNFEKLVVVVVLFLSAVVLAVSLRGGDEEDDPKNPMEAAGVVPDPALVSSTDSEASVPASTDPAREKAPGYFLDAGSSLGGASPAATPEKTAGAPASGTTASPRILATTQGLTPSALDEFMVYTAVEGDSWTSLADRFYANPAYLSNLREANEGMETLQPGAVILVPVFDFHAGAGSSAPAGSGLAAVPPGPTADSSSADRQVGTTPGPSGTTTYEVKDGDNLSRISKVVYGTTTRWADIYEANRDQLASPDKLKVGMKLEIPAASATGASTTLAVNAKPEAPKAAKSAAAKPASTDKKRRVQ